ncbi:unnamed protein product [Bursaphelenchus okinawaensis]|uniref:Nuclear receptor domain-containing protein n=1 Tax=Bursaphelenchus okinawaensis TaxID=465554 RepID=A0A811KXV7_9BILA|nr:unnamed protein product [Bursaphelenchus okinawaensis]CAG9114025.1 unnamed protein product [Bursaphelenchus okinawaensis]
MEKQSPSNSKASLSFNECQVCSAPKKFQNGGGRLCRSCAAFFRRYAATNRRYYCAAGKNVCKIYYKDTFKCKSCRFEQCQQELNTIIGAPKNLNNDIFLNVYRNGTTSLACQLVKAFNNVYEFEYENAKKNNPATVFNRLLKPTKEQTLEFVGLGNQKTIGTFIDCISHMTFQTPEQFNDFKARIQQELALLKLGYLSPKCYPNEYDPHSDARVFASNFRSYTETLATSGSTEIGSSFASDLVKGLKTLYI